MITFSKLGNPLSGRLGNQLFQIAATIAIAKKNGHQFVFPQWSYKDYFENELPTGICHNAKVYKQQSLNYYDVSLDINTNWDLQGFFQSERFFADHEDAVRHYFTPSENLTAYIKDKYAHLLADKTCSVHVRRGDYKKLSNYFPVQPLEYYTTAMSRMGDGLNFLIFSDDIEWCKSNFKRNGVFFVEG